ncbi:phage holin family protein [Belliella sp. DSM 107340]|uniref:Phage holin family protein n=1 Tax=Belliella calami TaxID=2923436 RepID=A0ABS9UU24_9BACT|nr:phage holin family protein [Belliella calami]MCH7400121.1 phage holin family protein [Belliella calami]
MKILKSFGYENWTQLGESLAPSFKYQLTIPTVTLSGLTALVSRVFGLDAWSFGVLLIMFMVELRSGIRASKIRGEQFESMKLSRFSFKVFYYLVIIAVTHLMSFSYAMLDKPVASEIFSWMQIFLVIQIVHENIVSIAENISVISGKPKAHWINKLSDKVNGFFK